MGVGQILFEVTEPNYPVDDIINYTSSSTLAAAIPKPAQTPRKSLAYQKLLVLAAWP
jgi:hypothetical protein